MASAKKEKKRKRGNGKRRGSGSLFRVPCSHNLFLHIWVHFIQHVGCVSLGDSPCRDHPNWSDIRLPLFGMLLADARQCVSLAKKNEVGGEGRKRKAIFFNDLRRPQRREALKLLQGR
jgi:hypothetical protein